MKGGIRGAHSRYSVFSLILPIMSSQPSKVNSSEACLLGMLSPEAPVVSPQQRLCQDLPAAGGWGRAGTAGRAKNRVHACLGRRAFESYLSPIRAEVVSNRGPGLRQDNLGQPSSGSPSQEPGLFCHHGFLESGLHSQNSSRRFTAYFPNVICSCVETLCPRMCSTI